MDIEILKTALREIEKNIKVLENSKFEKSKTLVKNGRQVKITLSNEDLRNLFNLENIGSIEKFCNGSEFSKNKTIKMFQFEGGFIIWKHKTK
jgi:hypothetical protein